MTDASYCPSFNPDLEAWHRLHPVPSSWRAVPVADLLLWHGRLRTLAAALYDLGHSCLADECWELATEIEVTANPIFEDE